MKKYNHKKIEEKWKKEWAGKNMYEHKDNLSKEKYYVLDMFPYPSGDGLHMGHTESYTASDIIYRYKKLQGFDVLHPQGFDSFGLPAENYAIKTGVHPKETTQTNANNYIKQMKMLGLGHDLNHLVYTSDPSYYKWTQWLFGKFFENGLVEQKTDKINWCPSCNTGIANEQVEDGKCERCKTEIEQKEVPGWFFKITDFAEDLINDLDKVDWPEATKKNQKAWIGRSEGAKIKFEIRNLKFEMNDEILNDEEEISNVVLVHGCADDENDKYYAKHWQPWIKKELEKRGVKVNLPLMPHPWAPVYEEHKKEFEKLDINENSILIGHSCGANFLVRWLSETGQKIKKLILVAPWNEPNHKIKEKAKFYDISKVDYSFKNNISDGVIIFTSDNEEKIGKDTAKMWTDKLNAKLIELKNHGHYTEGGMGTTKFPELLEEVVGRQKPNVVLVHGWGGTGRQGWFSEVIKFLDKKGITVVAPDFPNTNNPTYIEWEKQFRQEVVPQINENTIFVGHSLAPSFLMRYLSENNLKLNTVIFVAPVLHNKIEKLDSFFDESFNWNKIKKAVKKFIIVGSDNDPYIPMEDFNELAEKLSADFNLYKNRKHFSQEEKNNPEVVKLLEKVLSEVEMSPRESVFSPRNSATEISEEISVFTTRPDTLFGATYLVVAPEHELVAKLLEKKDLGFKNYEEVKDYVEQAKNKTEMERLEGKKKTGVKLEGLVAINPANNEEIPIFVADYVLGGYGTGAIMAVPAHDERDYAFASQMNAEQTQKNAEKIEIRQVVASLSERKGKDKVKDDKKNTKRAVINAIVKHWSEDKYYCLDWTKGGSGWRSFVSGGIEKGETIEEAAIREVKEETGYQNMKVVKKVGGEIVSKFFAVHKDINREINAQCVYIELLDDEWVKPNDKDVKNHDGKWINKKDVAEYITIDDLKQFWHQLFNGDELFTGRGVLVNSGQFDGMDSEEAKKAITEFVGGEMTTNYRLRDWSVSRQRYWGCPIPIVYSPEGEAKFVGEENLPWLLPEDVDFVPTGTAPLAKSKELKERTEKLFGKGWTPEVDTMDTFVDSSWYFLRYPDPENEKEFCSPEKLKRWLPVDLYIGGAEHTYMHLLYARFFVKAMRKMGLIEFNEPFLKLRHQGMVLDKDGIKMSKSKGNVVNPNDMVEKFGADATRMYMMFVAPLDEEIAFKEEGVKGVYRFLEKVFSFFERARISADLTRTNAEQTQNKTEKSSGVAKFTGREGDYEEAPKELLALLHKTIKGVTEDIEGIKFNTAISKLMIFINTASRLQKDTESTQKDAERIQKGAGKGILRSSASVQRQSATSLEVMEKFLILLSPFAPFITEELWLELGHKDSIFNQEWPKYNLEMIKEEEIELVVQINGKLRDKIKVPADISEEEAREKSLASEKIQKYTDGKEIRKVIFVKGRLINIVV